MSALLRVEGLHYAYPGGAEALAGLDLSIARGRRLAILGPNGAGKSTLLLHLNGTLRPARGTVSLAGRPGDYRRRGLIAWRSRVALVLQDADDQIFAATVAEDVSFGPLNMGLSEAEAAQRVTEALEALGIADLADRPTHMLSGGQKKRVAIAGAVAMRPDVLLLDEPTAGLDRGGTEQLIALLDQLAAAGMTLVFSTHDIDLALTLAEDVALFRAGRVAAQGPAEAILSAPDLLAEAGLKPPLLMELWQGARARGLLPKEAPLPRTAEGFLALLGG
ncbi:energy-coupling factor ABC transporter ATP-binding protein [Maritimibacter alkaliphilus]|uniref:energy-coupling factor ABC transporter ATP-binding protein n=1 Tax=Maritimibacter alkaliphilus TaxID=404236 RepID=UPI001C96BF9B|nr:ATP-binding cassette domain-containing protein [Maritimibacter alkaliphilus]MBY6092625.1 ATP-binding cassette domain-containing protein [Maritimibacter alkaliphilus]